MTCSMSALAGVSGKVTIEEALSQMLRGTGLTYRLLDNSTITILPASTPAPRQEAAPAPSPRLALRYLIPERSVRDRLHSCTGQRRR